MDYWDEGGWKDPFSSAALTSRQRNYGRQFHLDGVYTPQIVVDGQAELVGSRGAQVRDAIEKAAQQKQFDMTDAEVTHIRAALETWASYGVNVDRLWLEPLIEHILARAADLA